MSVYTIIFEMDVQTKLGGQGARFQTRGVPSPRSHTSYGHAGYALRRN